MPGAGSRGPSGTSAMVSRIKAAQPGFRAKLADSLAQKRGVVSSRAESRIGQLQAQRDTLISKHEKVRSDHFAAQREFQALDKKNLGASSPALMQASGKRISAEQRFNQSADKTRPALQRIQGRIRRLANVRDTVQGLENTARVNLKRKRKA